MRLEKLWRILKIQSQSTDILQLLIDIETFAMTIAAERDVNISGRQLSPVEKSVGEEVSSWVGLTN